MMEGMAMFIMPTDRDANFNGNGDNSLGRTRIWRNWGSVSMVSIVKIDVSDQRPGFAEIAQIKRNSPSSSTCSIS